MKWTDSTIYSQSEKPPRVPRAWSLQIDKGFVITVTCGHIHYRPEWIMHCFALGIDTRPLAKGIDADAAQAEAIAIVGAKLRALQESFNRTALGE